MSSTTSTAGAAEVGQPARRPGPLGAWLQVPEARWAVVATGLFALGGVAQIAGAPAPLWWALYLACYASGGWAPARDGLRALRVGRLDVDLLMVVAAVGAAAIGQVTDGALLIVIFSTSGALEALVTRRTRDAVRALLELAPARATRLGPDGAPDDVDADVLVPGDTILVHPGERIGADGLVLDGESEVDEATLTGEALPVVKAEGDEVFAGTLNGTGSLRVRVERPASGSRVAQIVAMVEEASATKAAAQLSIEAVEQRYSAGVVVAALALLGVPLALGAAFEPTLLRTMTFMIVASPCAVVLATMPPLLAVIADAGRHGVLVKSAVVLERLADIDLVAFDKTGTLTDGDPRVVEVHALGGATSRDALLAAAAAAEQPSEHPIGRAVVAAARDAGLSLPTATHFSSSPGTGVTATVAGHVVRVGSPKQVLRSVGPSQQLAELGSRVAGSEDAGRTAVVVLIDDRPAGVLALADRVRDGAAGAAGSVAAVQAVTGRPLVLLTGDNAGAGRALADAVGIADVRAGLLPADKAAELHALERQGHRVLLVGDGINDAPALAAAHVGVAMGARGSALAVETADVILVRDELETLPALLQIARRARRVVAANLAIAGTMIIVLVLWDLLGSLPLPLGVIGHEGSTVIVGLNGLRLLRSDAWRRPHPSAPAVRR